MASVNNGPSWSDQWGASGFGSANGDDSGHNKSKDGGNKKMENMKAAASAGFDKAKAAAIFGAQKVKSGTTTSIKWIKTKYQKRTSK